MFVVWVPEARAAALRCALSARIWHEAGNFPPPRYRPLSHRGRDANPISPPPGCAFHPRCPRAYEPCRVDLPSLVERDGPAVACHAVEAGTDL